MHRFRPHALQRFIERRPDLFPDNLTRNNLDLIKITASKNYRFGSPVTRTEAANAIQGYIFPGYGDVFYRQAEDGFGIWVCCRTAWGAETVITFLGPGDTLDAQEYQQAMSETVPTTAQWPI